MTFWLLLGFVFIVHISCSSSKNYSTNVDDKIDTLDRVNNPVNSLSLADHLQKLPGVSVRQVGQDVRITLRGFKTLTASAEPLYVVDGQQYRTYASASAAVDINDIKSVRILRDVNERMEYGMAGAQGVIEIILKKK